jgi:serine/threonine protein kinase
MAPEIFEARDGKKLYDSKCDIYSIGILFYYLYLKNYYANLGYAIIFLLNVQVWKS